MVEKVLGTLQIDFVLSLFGALDSHTDTIEKAFGVRIAAGENGIVITGEGDPAIDALVLQRAEAKKAKNWAEADWIRDELKAQGIEIVDTKEGASWKRV